jgi:hypothetical protein
MTIVWTQNAQEKKYELSEKLKVLHKRELGYLYGSSDVTTIVKSWWFCLEGPWFVTNSQYCQMTGFTITGVEISGFTVTDFSWIN